ncbi:MAG: hypothetical protein GY817_00715 [bacterium]|nr:hypothetical protein [bacterium]
MDINIEIPKKLQKEKFAFVKLKAKSKIPCEKGWQNKPYSYLEIQSWINQGNNYGVMGGYADLIIIDIDNKEFAENIKNILPNTFTVQTKKGYHFYYFCNDIKKKIILQKQNVHYGEIISKGSQVVAPSSIHPDTNKPYLVINNFDIRLIDKDSLYTHLKEYIPENLLDEKNTHSKYDELVKMYGEPYYLNDNDNVTSINQSFWAGKHKEKNIEIYEPNEKEFYRYDIKTGLYKEVTENMIKQEISQNLLQASRDNNLKGLEQKRTNSTLSNIVSQLKGIEEKKDVFNEKKKIIHLSNGVIAFNENNKSNFVEFSPSFYSRNISPILFKENAKCERFLNEFLKPSLDEDDILLLQKYIGLCLLGNNLIQRFLILDGKAGRGKSTLANIVQKLIGLNNVTELRTKHLGERFETHRYRKKTLLMGVDVPGKFFSEKGAYVIKGLVGGDCLDTEKKGGNGSFHIKGNYCILIISNSKLQVKLDGDVGAWRRRLLIINFKAPKPKKIIPNFADLILKEESSGILNWALEGLQVLFEDIANYGDIILANKQSSIIEDLLSESDSVKIFLNNMVMSKDGYDLAKDEIIEKYANYCSNKGWTAKPITIIVKEIKALMLELFRTTEAHSLKRDGKSVRGYRNVTFKMD